MNVVMVITRPVEHTERIPMSWEKYRELDEDLRGEYINGALVVSPHAVFRHQTICSRLLMRIGAVVPKGVEVCQEAGWHTGGNVFIPDLMVVDHPGSVWGVTSTPHLAVEVLSPSDPSRDTVLKHHEYAKAGLERYWIINPDAPTITTYLLQDGDYAISGRHEPGKTIRLDFGVGTVKLDPGELVSG